MKETISLEGRGVIPCPHNPSEAHPYHGPALRPADLLTLLGRARARQAHSAVAIDNLHRILLEEGILRDERLDPPHLLLEELHQALTLAQSVIPGAHREALTQIMHALERLDAYQDHLPPRGMA